MEKATEKKITWKDFFNNFFGDNDIELDLTEELKKSHLYDTINKLDEMAKVFNTPINCEDNKSTPNGGFSNGLRKDTLDKMREQLQGGIKVEKNENENKKDIER